MKNSVHKFNCNINQKLAYQKKDQKEIVQKVAQRDKKMENTEKN